MQAMVPERQAPIDASPLRLTDLPVPEPGRGEVRLRVSVCSVCRTDLHIAEGDLPPHRLPVVLGHQVVGRVERLGPDCTRLQLGERVGVAWLRHTDGTCIHCRRGRENLCEHARYTRYDADGGYAEHALAPEAFAYPLPESLDDAHAAPLLCGGLIGYRALARAAVPEQGRLLLAGFGSSAHLVIQLAVHRGHRCFVLSRGEAHRRQAQRLGAVWTGDDPAALPERMDSAILFAPVGHLVPPLLEALAPGGTLALAGIHLTDVPPLNYARHLPATTATRCCGKRSRPAWRPRSSATRSRRRTARCRT